MEYDGDQGAGFEDMGHNFGNFGNGTSKFTFNGQDASGMGVDPSKIFEMFFQNNADGMEGFSFGGMRNGKNK